MAQPTLPGTLALRALRDRKGELILKEYNFLCDYLSEGLTQRFFIFPFFFTKNVGQKILEIQKAIEFYERVEFPL